MRNARVWQQALGLARTVVEDVVFDEDSGVVVAPSSPASHRDDSRILNER